MSDLVLFSLFVIVGSSAFPAFVGVFLAFVVLPFLYSCKVYRNIENVNPKTSEEVKAGPFDSAALAKLVPGEKIIVNTEKGFKYRMTFSNLNGENLVGSVQKVNRRKVIAEEMVEIPIQEIENLYAKRKSAGV